MERRFDVRLEELLDDAVLDSRIPEGMLDRLEGFVKPFAAIMEGLERQRHLWEYVAGLFSDVKRKNAETIAYFHDQDRQALQKFIGQSSWDDGLLIGELSRQVGVELGESDGVLVFDPSAFRKQGKESVGVARQWCGRTQEDLRGTKIGRQAPTRAPSKAKPRTNWIVRFMDSGVANGWHGRRRPCHCQTG